MRTFYAIYKPTGEIYVNYGGWPMISTKPEVVEKDVLDDGHAVIEVAVVPAAQLREVAECLEIGREYVVEEISRRMMAGEGDARLELHRGYLARIDAALAPFRETRREVEK